MKAFSHSLCSFAVICAALSLQPSGAVNSPSPSKDLLPKCPPGWKVEVVAKAPQIRHPSVVCCAPDGRVFVAEDPMDISAPSANLALGRIVCFHPDGTTTFFAEKLYAVFGMQYLEGKLYVLHNPKFSVFRDDNGIGKGRVDLIESTNPNPWALDWNDHVPANFRLAMDGYFYMAVGDKGIYGAVGRDGKRVDLHGGGVLRMRPDATGLEVYCTGLRNILDVAVNVEDEIFTYDNTDERKWMSRLTHMVDGGFYGYPYDFIPRRPYTLWMMADYGPGAATGTVAYNEDALPTEYHGSLFLSDFGKRQTLHVRVDRDGATYKVLRRQDFFQDVPEDFRPVGIALAPDGMSFYLCDWQHKDVKAKVEVGRLLKLTYTGKSLARAKPNWYVPAAMGRKFDASTKDLIQALTHPAQSVRMVAQRRLADRGVQALPSLSALLSYSKAPLYARWHALWALDAIDGGTSARAQILKTLSDPEVSVRRQVIRQLGTRRVREATDILIRQLADKDALIRFHAATALGRIANPLAVPPLLEALKDADFFARYAAFTALRRIGQEVPKAWSAIADGLESDNEAVRTGTMHAMREVYAEELAAILTRMISDRGKPVTAREATLTVLAALHHQRPAWRGEWWTYWPADSAPPPKTVAWSGTPQVLTVLAEQVDDPYPRIREISVKGLGEARHLAAAPKLREAFQRETDSQVKRTLLQAFGDLKDAQAAPLIEAALADPNNDSSVLIEAIGAAEQISATTALLKFLRSNPPEPAVLEKVIAALGNLRANEAFPLIRPHLQHSPKTTRVAAITALGRIASDDAIEAIAPVLNEEDLEVRKKAIAALGASGSRKAVPLLNGAFLRADTQFEATNALARIPDIRAMDAYLAGLASPNPFLRESCRKAVRAIRDEALPMLDRRAELAAFGPQVVEELQGIYADAPKAKDGPIFRLQVAKQEPAEYANFALKNSGDAERGKKLFSDLKGVACIKCHRISSEGSDVGPVLAPLSAQITRQEIIDSILYPSKAVREGYQAVTILTTEGQILTGLVKQESGDELVLQDAEGARHQLQKSDIERRENSKASLMPDGLNTGLSLQAFADIVAFLESLREKK